MTTITSEPVRTGSVSARTGATPHALAEYEPEPGSKRIGIGLCLSGGGFRAALFHLGALRRLNESGVLARIRTVSAVSGGSILSAHLATRIGWPLLEPVADWDERVAQPFRRFVAHDIRTGPILSRLAPWNWFRSHSAVFHLADKYKKDLTPLTPWELPDQPNFVFCATDMAFGVNWIFEKRRMGDYKSGYVTPPPEDWSVGRAVAASSCFPPVFNPMPVRVAPSLFSGGDQPPGPERDDCIRDLRLTDGGNYDNMGLEPVWKDHRTVLVSDGGATFTFEGDRNLIWRIKRYTAIVEKQALALRKRWLISSFISGTINGTYWGIASATSSYDENLPGGYSKDLAETLIARIRTDLDAFSEGECAVLENHGYLLADAALRRHLPEMVAGAPSPRVPHPDWMDEMRVRKALASSGKRKLLGRG
ncbi:MAG: patatin-like phospholipase family protein [Thermoanaerobaculia bacterium]